MNYRLINMILVDDVRHFVQMHTSFLCGKLCLPAFINDIHAFAAGETDECC